jgi:hypothetical protein
LGGFALNRKVLQMSILETYEKLKHLDGGFSDPLFRIQSPMARASFLLWQSVKQNAAQQSVHLTALRRGLALSLLFNVILLAVVMFIIGVR